MAETEIEKAYADLAEHTLPVCRSCEPKPYNCCDAEFCENAARFAKEQYGITLRRTKHPKLPFMGKRGCTVAPHLRPVCTVHTCDIGNLGFYPGEQKWSAKYYRLRARCDRLEAKRMKSASRG